MADALPSDDNFVVQFEWVSLLLSDYRRLCAAALHAGYNIYRSQITDDKAALGTLERQHYKLQCYITPIFCLPVEITMEIFRTVLDIGQQRTRLMLVCQRWCQIIERMPDVWVSLNLGARAAPEKVQQLLNRAGTHPLAVEIKAEMLPVDIFYSSLAMVSNIASQLETLTITSLPQPEQVRGPNGLHSLDLQPSMNQLKHLKVMQSPSSSLLNQLLQNVAAAAVGSLVSMDIHSFPAIQCFLQPANISIFGSLTTFRAKVPRMSHGLDILPHFKQLEVLDLTNVLLPAYDNSSPLPFALTLHHLHLKSVSIQWMGGRLFPQLERCTIISPLPEPSLQSDVHLPACTKLYFRNWTIFPLGQICAPLLYYLRVRSSAWSPYKGNIQVAQLCRTVFGTSFPRILSLNVVCTDRLLLTLLRLLPDLKELGLYLPRLSALGKHFFTGLLAKPGDQLTGKLKLDWKRFYEEDRTGWKPTVCPSLKVLELHYEQWLRPGDNHDFLLPLFALSWSRERTGTKLKLQIHYKSSLDFWESFQLTPKAATVLSELQIPGHNQVNYLSLKTATWGYGVHEAPHFTSFLRHLQVLQIQGNVLNVLPSFLQLRELVLENTQVPPLAPDLELPLAQTLRKLSLWESSVGWASLCTVGEV